MSDVALEWPSVDPDSTDGDFSIGADGDIAFCDGAGEARQRVTRRCLTNQRLSLAPSIYSAPEVEWDVTFGEGFRRLVGDAQTIAGAERMRQRLLEGMSKDRDVVASSPPPRIAITPNGNGPFVVAVFTPVSTGKPTSVPLHNLP